MTPGLQIPHVAPAQSGKMAAINSAADALDGALTQESTIDVSGSADVTPSPSAVLPRLSLLLTGVLTASINLILPSSPHLWFCRNEAVGGSPPYTITVRCGAGSTLVLNQGDVRMFYADSVNVVAPN